MKLRTTHAGIAALCLMAALLSLASAASGQTFTLTADPLSPDAVAPGGTSSSVIVVGAVNGFSGVVNLGCTVTPTTSTDTPVCTVSPSSVTAPADASATITTQGLTSTVGYTITITGTAPSIMQTISAAPQTLTVLAVTPQFTVTVEKAVVPNSVPAGSGGQGTVIVTPINGYQSPGYPTGGVTLSCATITPLVTIPPVCSFTYPNGQTSLPVNGVPATSTITISTYGPVTTAAAAPPRIFYALWLPVPMLALLGLGAVAGGKRSRKAWGLLTLLVIAGVLCLTPACGNTTTAVTSPNGVTPVGSYSFTLIGVDSNGVISSNTGSTTSANPTVSLSVTTPTP